MSLCEYGTVEVRSGETVETMMMTMTMTMIVNAVLLVLR